MRNPPEKIQREQQQKPNNKKHLKITGFLNPCDIQYYEEYTQKNRYPLDRKVSKKRKVSTHAYQGKGTLETKRKPGTHPCNCPYKRAEAPCDIKIVPPALGIADVSLTYLKTVGIQQALL
jgi:hypothetical protein